MRQSLDTLGKNLNQDSLRELAEYVFITSEAVIEDWQDYTLAKIIEEALFTTNDFYMDDAFDSEAVIEVNKLIVQLRTV